MINLKIVQKEPYTAANAKKRFMKLQKAIDDMTPVWKQFIPFYQDLIKKAFQTRGLAMGGHKWPIYSESYRKRKKKSKGMLRLTDKLYDATQGGSGWGEKISKDNLILSVEAKHNNFDVARHNDGHVKGGKIRQFFYTQEGGLPNRAWAFLHKTTVNYLEGSFE